jgi:hypothetical protein
MIPARRLTPLVLLAFLLAGCSTVPGSATSGGPAPTPPGPAPATPRSTTGAEAAASLGSSTGQHRANPNDPRPVPLRIDVTGLDRNGDLIELAMTLTNEAPASAGRNELDFAAYNVFGEQRNPGGAEWDLSAVALVDQVSRLAYLPVLDSAGECLCTRELGSPVLDPGDSIRLVATFGGAPADLRQVDLHVPGFAPITGLGIGQ